MMHVLGCEHVRERLEAFQDGELPLDEQIGIQQHLRDCVTCSLESAELSELGDSLRAAVSAFPDDRLAAARARLPAQVVEQLRVERQLSFMAQMRARFEDMHLVWAAAGATVATVVCLLGSMGVMQAANRERPDSLAGIITYLANPGSNANPARPDGRMLLPRPLAEGFMPMTQDAVFAMAAVVTREGRVQDLQLLAAEQAQALHVKPEVVLAMLEAASRARFVPAQAGGEPIAVSMVWLVEMTTVKGQNDYDLFLVSPPRWIEPRAFPELPKPSVAVPVAKVIPSTESSSA